MYLGDGLVVSEKQAVGTCVPDLLLKGGNPAAPSGTATLLRLSPSQRSCFRRLHDLEHSLLPWLDGRCVQGPGTYSPWCADPRLLAIPASRSRVADSDPN